jgi:hypothetical protein
MAATALFFLYPETGADRVYSELELLDRLLVGSTTGREHQYRGRRHMRDRRAYLQRLISE